MIWNLRIRISQKFANFQMQIEPKSLRICNSRISKNICAHLCKFATRVNDPDGKFAAGVKFSAVVNDTSGNLPLVSMTSVVDFPPVSATTMVVHLELRIFLQIFKKISNGPNGILRGLGETDSWKNWKSKISWHCPFKLPLAHTKFYIVKATDLMALFL